jgi:hypothetical protein
MVSIPTHGGYLRAWSRRSAFLDWADSATNDRTPTWLHPVVDRARLPGKDMNWRRGLFRAWIVLSILWMLCILLAYLVLPEQSVLSDAEFLNATNESDVRQILTAHHRTSQWEFALGAIVPPLGALALGLAAFWVGKGFRRLP